jgi:signal peptidase I
MATSSTSKRAATKKGNGGLGETVRFVLVLFLLALILKSFFFAAFSIPSGSMLPRLMIGEYLFVAKWPYGFSRYSLPFGIVEFDGRIWGRTAKRGDVAVFRYPGGGGDDWVKRIIGLPGDTVQMRGGTLILNGKAVPKVRIADYLMPVTPNSPCRYFDQQAARTVTNAEGSRFCAYPRFRETLPGGASYEIIDQLRNGPADDTLLFTVPPGHYFAMGDNRDDSEDSRFPRSVGGIDFLPEDYLIGRAAITFFSTDGSAEWLKPWTWVAAARWERIGETF